MNFKNEMRSYFKLRNLDERKKKIHEIISQLEKRQYKDGSIANLNMAEAIIEYCLLIENNDERLLQYDRALELVHNTRRILKEKNQIRQLLRSYHLECFIKYHTTKYKDEEASIQDIFNLGGKIIEITTRAQEEHPNIESNDYYSLGCVWRAYGLIQQFIIKSRELSVKQKHSRLEKARELANKAVELNLDIDNRDTHLLSAYILAFAEELQPIALRGDKATTEEKFIDFMHPYEILFDIARKYGSIEFEYLSRLNHTRLKLLRVNYAAGVSERKKEIFNELLDDCKKLDEYENLIYLPHLHFNRYYLQTYVFITTVHFEAVLEKDFNDYIDKAINSAEKMKETYTSANMKGARDKGEMHHILNEVYWMKSSFATSRTEKLYYLKKCEDLLLESEKISAAWSPQIYNTWRDLSSIYLELSKAESNQTYFKKCVFYAKKAYKSALETNEFKDALFEAYKIAIITEDYQEYTLSIKNYELASHLIDKIILAGKDYPYYHDLKTYLQGRLLGVKAKDSHRKGSYAQAMNLYKKASSLLQPYDLYSYEGMLYNAYALLEEASMQFIGEKYRETLKILLNITRLFNETLKQHTEDYEPQFRYFIDRRAYDLQQLFFESSKAFCIAQSNILQSLIYRNTGDSEKAIELLIDANTLLTKFTDRNIHIAGYYSFANGLYGLEKSELAVRDSEYKNAASYLASASDQFENASQVLASDERLSQLCEGLMSFCRGWMYALEIMRCSTDLTFTELNTNFTLAHQSFLKAIRYLKMFTKTCSGVYGFERLLNYIYYSLLFQKTEDPIEKSKFKDNMTIVLEDALQYFKKAEDMERYEFTRDLITNLPQLEDLRENVFKPIDIPFTPYTPVFDTLPKVEPSGVNFVVSLDKTHVEVKEKIKFTIQVTSSIAVHIKQIEGVFPTKGVKVVSGMRFIKNGKVKIDRLLSPGQSIVIEFTIQTSTPFYSRKNPQLIYFTMKNEKFRTFSTPYTMQVYPKGVLKTGVVSEINEKVDLIRSVMKELGIAVGDFPILYHDIKSYRETLSEFFVYEENKEDIKKGLSKRVRISQIPIKQMAFVDPLADVNILYDTNKYLFPQSVSNLLNIIIHEKFGHGFFYQNTTLGKKLLELEYHRKGIVLLTKELEKISNKYAIGIQWLCMSTLIPNEGFATWLTLKTFEKLLEKISENNQQFAQQIQDEKDRIKKSIFENENLKVSHEYFILKYETPIINPYAWGYDLCSQIDEKYGEICVPKALEIVTDIPLTKRQISRMQNTLKNNKNCADKRLEKIAQSYLEIERNNIDIFETAARKLFS